jgi:predicted dehydrogenase
MDRRGFLKHSASGAASFSLAATIPATVLGANDRLRIGLIGCGSRGNFLMEQALLAGRSQNVEIAALCDVWSVNLQRTAASLAEKQQAKPKLFARYGDLLAMNDVDAVIIATPDFAHTPQLIDATKLKKDAFVEKPMATVLDHANEAIKLVGENQTIVQVGNQRRSDPRHQAAAKLIQSGILGKVSEVEAAWHDAAPRWARDYSDVRREDVDWEGYLMFLPPEPFRPERFRRWHFYEDFTVGTPALLGAHLIDVAIWFMDDPLPTSAVAHGGVYVWKDGREHADTLDCILEYPKQWIVNYSTRLGNSHPVPEAIFYGTRGTFDTQSWTARGEGGTALDALPGPITVPPPASARTAAAPVSPPTPTPPPAPAIDNTLAAAQNDPRVQSDGHVLNWLECVRSRKTPNAPVEVGYAHTLASIMSFQALKTGCRQVFDPETRTIQAG